MSFDKDLDFARAREAEERLAAANAGDPMIAEIHLKMAERYADRIWSIEEGMPNEQRSRIATNR